MLFFPLLVVATVALARILSIHPPHPAHSALAERPNPYQYSHAARDQPDAHLDDLELLDIVLLASVDGKLHALNRTSGETLWSMTPASNSSSSSPAALSPLVRTDHIDYDPEVTDDNSQAAYIIEPQSGDIYIMPNPSSPLQRFPFSMQELVDMSPFSFRGEDDSRVFVGKKETSLLVVELQTGKIKATLNSECPWDQFDNIKDELDLDELEDSVPPKTPPAEVYIGRTGMISPLFFQRVAKSAAQTTMYRSYPHVQESLMDPLPGPPFKIFLFLHMALTDRTATFSPFTAAPKTTPISNRCLVANSFLSKPNPPSTPSLLLTTTIYYGHAMLSVNPCKLTSIYKFACIKICSVSLFLMS